MDVAAEFRRVYNGEKNFITPHVIEYGKRGRFLYELSSGKFMHKRLYGVTVIDIARQRCHDMSKCFSSVEEARAYINSLKNRSENHDT